jgi:NAD-dependent deacetylase
MHENTGFRFDDAEPNRAHRAIAEMERLGKLDCIITQNVDGLHQKAGNSQQRVLELHGNMQWVKCISCGARHTASEVREWIDGGVEVPDCASCGGILKPDAVFFGESMPPRETAEAQRRSVACDLCIVIGSTLAVYPAALMPEFAVRSGAKLVIVNEGATELDHAAHLRIEARAGEAMTRTLELVGKKLGVAS